MGIENDILKIKQDIEDVHIIMIEFGKKLNKLLEQKSEEKKELSPENAKSLSHIQHSKCCDSKIALHRKVPICMECDKACEIVNVQDY